jgi:hypothetical protein
MSVLNLFKTTLYTTYFDHHWSSSGDLKLFVETAVLVFCTSNVVGSKHTMQQEGTPSTTKNMNG